MKKTIISICTAIALGTAGSCTDNFEDININPNKIYEANMESIFRDRYIRQSMPWQSSIITKCAGGHVIPDISEALSI